MQVNYPSARYHIHHLLLPTVRIFYLTFLVLVSNVHTATVLANNSFGNKPQSETSNQTVLINRNSIPEAVIVIPGNGKYKNDAERLQETIKKRSGVKLTIVYDSEADLKNILSNKSLVVLGNMYTSHHIRLLYEQWYTFLDLKYPGSGGSVVRTLLDPYSTGRDVILLGGSDDAGVSRAVKDFIDVLDIGLPLLQDPLMKIRLGEGIQPPAIGETVYSWDDSWRLDSKGRVFGYPPATNFGWNPISANAALYYMTGRKKYLDRFLQLALPDPTNIPAEINTASLEGSSGKAALLHPIAHWQHYTSHIFPLIWDLIEESPGITPQQRKAITHDLLAHTRLMEKRFNRLAEYSKGRSLSRHGLYYALNLYTASRYFSKHEPGQKWVKRLDSVQKVMAWWLQEPTWGKRDTMEWINTTIEPVFTYYTLAGYKDFIDSGMAEKLIAAIHTLWQGYPNEMSNKYQSISLMLKAAWLLDDGRYAWLALQPDYNFNQFRIGQSWWPVRLPEEIYPNSSFSIIPTNESVKNRYAPAIDTDKSFQFLAWRSGYDPDDDYLLLDGLNQDGRHPHHVAALTALRHSDNPLLSGYENQLFILRDGLIGNHVPKAASLDMAIELGSTAYIRTTVPDGPFSSWQRHILHLPGVNTLVADKVTAKTPGNYELLRQWNTVGWAKASKVAPQNIAVPGKGRVAIATDKKVTNHIIGARIDQRLEVKLDIDESITLFSTIHANPASGRARYILESVGPDAAFLKGDEHVFITTGPYTDTHINSDAAFSYLSPKKLILTEGTILEMSDLLMAADNPVSINWQLDNGHVTITTDSLTTIRIHISDTGTLAEVNPGISLQMKDGFVVLSLKAGTHTFNGIFPHDGQQIPNTINAIDTSYVSKTRNPTNNIETHDWRAQRIAGFNAPVLDIKDATTGGEPILWVATGKPEPALHLLTTSGETRRIIQLPSQLNVLERTGENINDDTPFMIAGGQDNELRAYNQAGDLLWRRTSKVADKFRQGTGFYAPWFTDPDRVTGIRSLLIADTDNDGKKEIIVGRPSTVEYWDLGGHLLQRIPMPSASRLGTVSEIELLETEQGNRILLGQDSCGIDAVSLLDENRNFISLKGINRPYLTPMTANSTDMTAWAQRGISSLEVSDLDLDNNPEVILSRSGHWNDLRVYSADGLGCRWMHSFGPGEPIKTQHTNGSLFIRDVLVANINGDNKEEVVASLANGRIMVFSANGESVWTGQFNQPAILANTENRLIAGFEDGILRLFDINNNITSATRLGSGISAMVVRSDSNRLYAGTAKGNLFSLTTVADNLAE